MRRVSSLQFGSTPDLDAIALRREVEALFPKNAGSRYSLLRGLNKLSRGEKLDGEEGEWDAELRRNNPALNQRQNNFAIPTNLAFVKRGLVATSPSAGGYLAATENVSFSEMLRDREVVSAMGATRLSGLVGNVTIPKQTASGTAYWLANDSTPITESQQTLGQLALSPKNVGAYTEISRQLMMQSSPAADALVMKDLAKVVALAIDKAALNGSGTSGEPTGIINTSGIGSVSGTSIAYAGVLEFQTDVAGANVDSTKTGYVSTPAVAGLLMQRQRFSGTDSPLWVGNMLEGKCADLRAMTSMGMPSASLLFGDWSQLVIAEWGVLELALNPYADFKAGIIGVRAMQTVDVGVRHAGAFSLATSVT